MTPRWLLRAWDEALEEDVERKDEAMRSRLSSLSRGMRQPKKGWRPKGKGWLVDSIAGIKPVVPVSPALRWGALAVLSAIIGLLIPDKIAFLPLVFGVTSQLINLDVPDSHLGDALRAGGQKLNDWQFSGWSVTYFAGASKYTGTTEQKITACAAQALAEGGQYVLIPLQMLRFNANLVVVSSTIRLFREGGNPSCCDIVAYGADWQGINDSTTAIQTAMTAAGVSLGINSLDCRVEIPSGIYKTSAGITVPQNVKVSGDGQSRSIIAATTSGAATLILTYGSPTVANNCLSDFSIDGAFSGGTPAGHGISITNAFDVTVERVSIQGLLQAGQNGIQAVNAENSEFRKVLVIAKNIGMNFTSNSNNVKVDTCNILNPSTGMAVGIAFDNTTVASMVIATNLEGAGATPGGIGVQCDGTLGLQLIGNFIENWATAAISATTGVCQALYVQGGAIHATNAATAAIKYNSAGTNNGITVQNVFFVQLGQGGSVSVGVDLGTTTGPIQITGNRCPGGANALVVRVNGVLQSAADYMSLTGVTGSTGAIREGRVVLTWSAAPAIDASAGNEFELTATSNIAMVVATPTNTPTGLPQSQPVVVEIFNNSGGALTTPPTFTLGAGAFRLTAAAVNPPNGQSVLYTFKWSNIWGRYVETARTIAY